MMVFWMVVIAIVLVNAIAVEAEIAEAVPAAAAATVFANPARGRLHRVCGNQRGQPARANREFAFAEKLAQPVERAAHAFLGGVFA